MSKTPTCKYCGSRNVYKIARVVGFFSIVDDWNAGKKAELEARHKGNYTILGVNNENNKI